MVEYHVVFKPKYNYGIFLKEFNLTITINRRDIRDKGCISFIMCSCWIISDLGGIRNSWK